MRPGGGDAGHAASHVVLKSMGPTVMTLHQRRKRRKMRCRYKLLERHVSGTRHEGKVEVGSLSDQQSKGGHIFPPIYIPLGLFSTSWKDM